jgi:hypothetical protein
MIKFLNFKSLLFKILFIYILISMISFMFVSFTISYFFNKLTNAVEKGYLINKSVNIYRLPQLVKAGTSQEHKFNRNIKSLDSPYNINIEGIKEYVYFKEFEVNRDDYKYMILGTTLYDRHDISSDVINMLKKEIEKHCNLLLYNFAKKLCPNL